MQNRDQKDRPKRRQQFRQRSRDGTSESYDIPRVDSSVPVRPPKGWQFEPYIINDDDAKNKRVAVYCRVSTSENEEVRSCRN